MIVNFPIQFTGTNKDNSYIESILQYAISTYPGGGLSSGGPGYLPTDCT